MCDSVTTRREDARGRFLNEFGCEELFLRYSREWWYSACGVFQDGFLFFVVGCSVVVLFVDWICVIFRAILFAGFFEELSRREITSVSCDTCSYIFLCALYTDVFYSLE